MERLTQPGQDFERQFCRECGCTLFGEPNGCNHPNCSCHGYCYFTTVAEQLAAYEDTGLTPKDVVDLMGNHAMAISELAKVQVYTDPTVAHSTRDTPTVYGYNVKHLALIAEMLRKQLITKDKMAEVFKDFEEMYYIICQAHHTELKKKTLGFVCETTYPSALDVAAQMQKLDHLKEVKATVKERPWNDLREHSGLVEED